MKNYKPLLAMGCIHIGHRAADLAMAKRYVAFAKETGAHVLLLSDNFENCIPKKGHMMFDQVLTPQEQLDYGEELFSPIRKQIVGIVQGNHSGRTRKEAGFDMDYELAKHLGRKKAYFPNQGYIALRAGKHTYGVAFKHGTGFGANTFGNCITMMRQFPSADLVVCSHTHELATTTKGFWDIEAGRRVKHNVVLVNTGSLMDFPNYADEAYYSPQPKGFAVIWLGERERAIKVDVSGSI